MKKDWEKQQREQLMMDSWSISFATRATPILTLVFEGLHGYALSVMSQASWESAGKYAETAPNYLAV